MRYVLAMLCCIIASSALFPARAKPRVALLDFTPRSVSADEALSVSDLFRGELVTCARFDVLDRNNMKNILKEQQFQQTGCTESTCAVKIGRMLNMEYMIYGSILRLGDSFFLQAEVVNIETARIVLTAKEKFFSMGNVDDAIRRVVDNLGGRLTTDREEVVRKDPPRTETPVVITRPAPVREPSPGAVRWSDQKFWMFIGGIGALAAGGGCNIAGFLVLGGANDYYNNTYLATSGVSPADVSTRYNNYNNMVTTGDVLNIGAYSLYGIGAGLIVWALFFMPDVPAKTAHGMPLIDIAVGPNGDARASISYVTVW